MILTTPYSATFYVGDGETKTFPYLFEEVSESFISVIVYNSLTGQSSTPTYIVDTDQKQVIFGDDTPAPTADETVCIYRNTPNVQDTPFRTLQGYDAKALENILSKIVAMIQEIKSNYFTTQVLQGDPWQLDLLTSADDGATVNIDYTAKKLVKGLYFKITDGNLQVSADGSNYITMPKSDDVAELRQVSITLEDLSVIKKLQYRIDNEWFDAETNAQATADEALALAQTVQGGLSSHVSDTNNPHDTSVANLKDTNITNPVNGQYMMFDGLKWKNVSSSATAGWGTIIGNITDQTDLMNKFAEYVRTDGTSIMTQPLLMRATDDFKCAIAPYWDGVGFFKLNNNNSVTLIASLEYQDSFAPAENNVYNIGSTSKKWKNLYLAGKAYMSVINNGYDIAIPVTNSADTFALKSQVDLAANSGDQLTEKGVWYAKMYSATVAPSAEDGTNYADFSQTDGQGNPIIVIYKRQNGAWVQDQTITPPAEYNGYVPVTSKIWDIVEQSGQQGGKVLWSHNQKTFTPSPLIISFDGQNITNSTFSYGTITSSTFSGEATLSGNSTVIMPVSPTNDNIVNKGYLDAALINHGTGRNVGDVFLTMRNDNELNGAVECNGATYNTTDFIGAQSIGELLEAGKLDYVSLSAYSTAISTKGWCDKIGWDGTGNTVFRVPTLNAHIVQTNNIPVVGNGIALGLTDGTNNMALGSSSNLSASPRTTTNYGDPIGTFANSYNGSDDKTIGITTDGTKSGIIADTTDTAQLRVMIQIANSATDEALETCTSVLADVATLKGYDYVVDFQAPTAANNYTWYRKYKSGWVEQGGVPTSTSTVTLPIPMADSNYWFIIKARVASSYNPSFSVFGHTPTPTGFPYDNASAPASDFIWTVSGMAAS